MMTQAQLNRAVARVTGESMDTIQHLGFVPLTGIPTERTPLIVDWDRLDSQRYSIFPQRRQQTALA
jgi:hypothetical protein